ncbi:hypothetical protein N0V85_009664 [Neurospora sp. IMI 360204]|nr:hypothetical protein N0V85_009664 [Neurospora sp. IMI 360204]
MTGRATSSRPAKRQHTYDRTETVHLTSDYEKPVAASRAGKTQTLPANFNGDLNTLPDFNVNAQKLPSSQIARLPGTFTNSLLAYAAARDPYINPILAHKHDLQRARERARVIDFTHYAQSAWAMLNTKYARLSSSKAYEKAFDVVSDIGKMFDNILKTVKKAGGYDCSYGTRKNAVETMIEIMMCMVTAPNDEIGHQARNDDDEATEMENKLLEMMTYFDEGDLAQLDEEGWTDKIRELIDEADGYYMYGRLNEVVQMLEGDYEEDGEEDGDEDGEAE